MNTTSLLYKSNLYNTSRFRYTIAVIIFFITISNAFAQAPAWQWAQGCPNPQFDNRSTATTTDQSGNLLVAGYFNDTTITLGGIVLTNSFPQSRTLFIAKMDSAGNALWAFGFGAGSYAAINAVTTDQNDNIYITGWFYGSLDVRGTILNGSLSTAFVAKFDSNRVLRWASATAGTQLGNDYGVGVCADTNGVVSFAGSFESDTLTFQGHTINHMASSNSGHSIFVFQIDSSGNYLWGKSYGGNLDDYINHLKNDLNGNLYMEGSFYSKTIQFDTITFTNVAYAYGGVLVKLQSSGIAQWVKQVNSKFWNEDRILDVSKDGVSTVVGYYSADTAYIGTDTLYDTIPSNFSDRFFIAQYDSSGAIRWAKNFCPTPQWVTPWAITREPDGTIYISGEFQGDTLDLGNIQLYNSGPIDSGYREIFVSRYNSTGTLQWAKSAGGKKDDSAGSVNTDHHGKVFVTGYFLSDTIAFDNHYLYSNSTGNPALYIALLGKTSLTGIPSENEPGTNVIAYPNPGNGTVHLKSMSRMDQVTVSNLTGQIISKTTTHTNEITIQLPSAGLYFVTIVTDGKSVTKKLVVE